MSTSSLATIRMDSSLRNKVADTLVPSSKIKVVIFTAPTEFDIIQDMLYVLLVAGNKVVTLVRPKKHSIHPSGMRTNPC